MLNGVHIPVEGRGSGQGCLAYLVATAMDVEFGGQRNAANEEEEGVEGVGDQHEERMDGKGFVEGAGDQVDERQHAEDGDEHDVIDNGRVVVVRVVDHVAHQGEDEQRPQKLNGRTAPGVSQPTRDSSVGNSRGRWVGEALQ